MVDAQTMLLTWTTYGTWLPGDDRGWRSSGIGEQPSQPLLQDWCRERLNEAPILLSGEQRSKVESVLRAHAQLRRWDLHAIAVRTNHVHIVVTADRSPAIVRDQFKANATRVLRQPPEAIAQEHVWTRGGDCSLLRDEANLERAIRYVLEAQDRMDRPK